MYHKRRHPPPTIGPPIKRTTMRYMRPVDDGVDITGPPIDHHTGLRFTDQYAYLLLLWRRMIPYDDPIRQSRKILQYDNPVQQSRSVIPYGTNLAMAIGVPYEDPLGESRTTIFYENPLQESCIQKYPRNFCKTDYNLVKNTLKVDSKEDVWQT